jgi:hypothetical protein
MNFIFKRVKYTKWYFMLSRGVRVVILNKVVLVWLGDLMSVGHNKYYDPTLNIG